MKEKIKTICLNIIFYGALWYLFIWMFWKIFPYEQDSDIAFLALALVIVVAFIINFLKKKYERKN